MTRGSLLVDGFTFCNELDLLKFRLKYLNDVVDYFIITESRNTFSGVEKELHYENNKHLFERYKDKIIHIVVDLPSGNHSAWCSESKQRNSIKDGVEKLQLQETDRIVISDLDEIPDRDTLQEVKNNSTCSHFVLEQDLYFYNINCKGNKWGKAKVVTYNEFKANNYSAEIIRHGNAKETLRRGGWHFSYFGDVNFIKNKIKSFSHTELNTEEFLNDEKILKQIKTCDDLYFRHNESTHNVRYCSIEENTYLPVGYEDLLHFSKILTEST